MPFIKIEGFAGNIYVPEKNPGKKKHQCDDCYSCQFCSDERCELCLKKKSCRKRNPDPADNIEDEQTSGNKKTADQNICCEKQ